LFVSGCRRTRLSQAPEAKPVTLNPNELRLLLVLRGRRARDVAQTAGISRPTLSRILSGKRRADAQTLARIESAILAADPDAADGRHGD
jgi:transcriptional regulator with XRE-family HTH domain